MILAVFFPLWNITAGVLLLIFRSRLLAALNRVLVPEARKAAGTVAHVVISVMAGFALVAGILSAAASIGNLIVGL